ncbi:filamentation induced by cAMP protein fic [Solemya pervernicosa gill symbiont]|uniref:Filamentation induced by cAMP protein fic n=2 Tax=Gammaproteobacteria incertae sedis TaxID=118884 RepID=A0A1T2L1E1_9GAMM|nr:Fic family protein [Candidatus Reidiella endopervernicosa]OOZ38891.1 filamentation induced by cAMP protein fic [Solemya pervernicosa gill symbiont]QKQ27894.1 Fic family protein [Candidatus Reidiella endopervernicosa]
MKMPVSPPPFNDLIADIVQKGASRVMAITALNIGPAPKGNYYHWDKLRHLKPPGNLSHEEWWYGIKSARLALYRPIPHTDVYGTSFVFTQPDIVQRLLHQITRDASGVIQSPEAVTNPQTKDTYLVNSLIEEAITSSQLEGASTTRKVAKEMIRQKRKPLGKSEKMIINNFHAMQFVSENKDEELTPQMIFELHRLLTIDTMENPAAVGRLRESDDIYVGDERDATTLHIPPKAAELNDRLDRLCTFANEDSSDPFFHPVIKAIILHFMLAYDHPFEDGNGRTARALFYWCMLNQGYWLIEFISISRILKTAPAKYSRAYLHTETDNNDVTYFITHQLNVITAAIRDLYSYLERKSKEIHTVEAVLKRSPSLRNILNHRQVALLNRALKKPNSLFTIESHRSSHNVVYQTARSDLLDLVELALLIKGKSGKSFSFTVPEDIKKRLDSLDQ